MNPVSKVRKACGCAKENQCIDTGCRCGRGVKAKYLCSKRNECDKEQEEHVEPHYAAAGDGSDVLQELVMVYPVDSDSGEAQREHEQFRHKGLELDKVVVVDMQSWNAQFKRKESNGDGEHSIAKGFESDFWCRLHMPKSIL